MLKPPGEALHSEGLQGLLLRVLCKNSGLACTSFVNTQYSVINTLIGLGCTPGFNAII